MVENRAIRTPSCGSSSSEHGNTVSDDSSEHPVTPESNMIRTESGKWVNFVCKPLNKFIFTFELIK